MSIKASFADRLACPDCGAIAERIGHYFEHADGMTGFQPDPIFITRKRGGGKYQRGDLGVETIEVGEKTSSTRGVSMTETVTRDALVVTHVCTNPGCVRVFPRQYAPPLNGELPAMARWEESDR